MTERLVFLADIYGVDDARDLSWMDRAVCVEVDPEVFHPGKGMPSEPAKELCRSCEARPQCLAYALDRADTWGVWGGFSAYGRVAVARQHQAGQSLKDIIAADDAAYYAWRESAPERAEAAMERQRERQRAKAAEARAVMKTPQPREQAA
jgi:WhiB family redox-sensing transcriptional regulator